MVDNYYFKFTNDREIDGAVIKFEGREITLADVYQIIAQRCGTSNPVALAYMACKLFETAWKAYNFKKLTSSSVEKRKNFLRVEINKLKKELDSLEEVDKNSKKALVELQKEISDIESKNEFPTS